MNQILYTEKYKFKFKFIFWCQFLLSFLLFIYFILLYFYDLYEIRKNVEKSNIIASSYNISTLYRSPIKYSVLHLANNKVAYIVGKIRIDKINIDYPIFSNTDEDLLKIAPCRFYGPMPNSFGNLCIAGHNYNTNQFFSNLYKLDIGDEISIFSSARRCY